MRDFRKDRPRIDPRTLIQFTFHVLRAPTSKYAGCNVKPTDKLNKVSRSFQKKAIFWPNIGLVSRRSAKIPAKCVATDCK